MKAAILHRPEDLRIGEVSDPALKEPGDVTMRIEWGAICGTDVHAYEGRIPVKAPIVMGHEYSGQVVSVGKAVRAFQSGDEVVGLYGSPCGSCEFCAMGKPQLCVRRLLFGLNLDGCLAEEMRVPRAERTLVKVSEGMDLREAVLVPDMFQTAMYSIEMGGVRAGSEVLITGVGAVGLSAVIAAKLAGASTVIAVDVRDRPLELAKRLGADHVIDGREEGDLAKKVRELVGGFGVDVAIEASGAPSVVKQALDALKPSGTHVQTGIVGRPVELDLKYLTALEKRIVGVLNPTSTEYLKKALEAVDRARIELGRLVTHEFSLEEADKAMETAAKKIGDPIKVVVKVTG